MFTLLFATILLSTLFDLAINYYVIIYNYGKMLSLFSKSLIPKSIEDNNWGEMGDYIWK